MEDALETVQQPGTVLIVAGAASAVLYTLFVLMGGLGVLMGCMGVGFGLLNDPQPMVVLFQSWGMILGFIGLLVNILVVIMGIRTVMAGSAMKELRDIGLVKQGMAMAAIGPILGLVMNLGIALLSFNICGCLTYTVPEVILAILGLAGAFLTHTALQDDNVLDNFEG